MPEDSEKEDDEALRIDTVPPPPGEDDAYNAPTRVGTMPPEVLAAMKDARPPSQPPTKAAPPAESPGPPSLSSRPPGEGDDDPTRLHPSARQVPINRLPPAIPIPSEDAASEVAPEIAQEPAYPVAAPRKRIPNAAAVVWAFAILVWFIALTLLLLDRG
jgi:hypothetical protein